MPLIPVFSNARPEVSAGTIPDRKTVDRADTTFRDTFDVARAERTVAADRPASLQRTDGRAAAAATDRAQADAAADAREANNKLAAQQQAQVRTLMLSGAMKLAGRTLLDGAAAPDVPLPQPVAAAADVLPELVIVSSLPSAVTTPPEALPDPIIAVLPAAETPQPAGALPGVIVASMPAVVPDATGDVAGPHDRDVRADASADVSADAAAPDDVTAARDTTPAEPAASPATLGALLLVANLPFPVSPVPSGALVPEHDETADDATLHSAPKDGDGQRQPAVDREPLALLEDHFDAPARDAQPASRTEAVTSASGARGRVSLHEVSNNLDALDPTFRAKLERVMERMHTEYGHRVTVVETVRSQARQDALFAQGRTAAGPVVTWTRHSKHADGRAADLMVDGRWDNPTGYAHLAAIARDVGLRTLGARDPGHVEMPGDTGVSSETLSALLGDLRDDTGDPSAQMRAAAQVSSASETAAKAMSRVANAAQVARVAQVAQVAQVARVSDVARPGERGSEPKAVEPVTPSLASLGLSSTAAFNTTELSTAVRAMEAGAQVNMADRISQLLDLQATQAAKPLNSVLLRMQNAAGIDDQIRIDTRGTLVDARLGLGNAQQAAALTDRIGELREALEKHGLTADSVRVQASSSRSIDSATFSRPAAPVLDVAALRAAGDAQLHGQTRDQSARDQQQRDAAERDAQRHTARASQDDARHRSRREQKETRQ
jgi:hypothetical protein